MVVPLAGQGNDQVRVSPETRPGSRPRVGSSRKSTRGRVNQCAGDDQSLFHPGGVGLDLAFAGTRVGLHARASPRHPGEGRVVKPGEHGEVVPPGETFIEVWFLKDEVDDRFDLGEIGDDIVSCDRGPCRRWGGYCRSASGWWWFCPRRCDRASRIFRRLCTQGNPIHRADGIRSA